MLRRFRRRVPGLLLVAAGISLHSQERADWKDPSPHTTHFVTASEHVRLEVLAWGGSGRPLILLAGGGETAHVFDDFAPRLAADFHVYGITRRGFGASGFSEGESGPDRFAEDVLVVADALRLQKPILVGHSIAGQELSAIANTHPERVAGVVYLDAGYPYAFDNGSGPAFDEFQDIKPPEPPPPGRADLVSFGALRQYLRRVLGVDLPEAELRQEWTSNRDGSVGTRRDFPGSKSLLSDMKKYAAIPVPALLIYANPHSGGRWFESSTDQRIRPLATAYDEALTRVTGRQVKAVESGVPAARVVTLPHANHHIYMSNEQQVLRELRSFVSGLP